MTAIILVMSRPLAAVVAAASLWCAAGVALNFEKSSAQLLQGRYASLAARRISNPVAKDRLTDAFVGGREAQRIPIVTVETRLTAARFPVSGAPGRWYTNLGTNASWHRVRTKPEMFYEWLDVEAAKDPDQLIVFADGGDVIFGGCSEAQLAESYFAAVAASGGALVVAGAELGIWPPTFRSPERYASLDDRRATVLATLNLQDASYARAAACRPLSDVFHKPGFGNWTGCSSPPALQYANSGFLMGPAQKLKEVVRAMAAMRDDQQGLAEYMLEHPSDVTLDYTGSLVLNLHQFRLNEVLDVQEDGATLRNKITGLTQCFVHGNGWSKYCLRDGEVHATAVHAYFAKHCTDAHA